MYFNDWSQVQFYKWLNAIVELFWPISFRHLSNSLEKL